MVLHLSFRGKTQKPKNPKLVFTGQTQKGRTNNNYYNDRADEQEEGDTRREKNHNSSDHSLYDNLGSNNWIRPKHYPTRPRREPQPGRHHRHHAMRRKGDKQGPEQ